MKRSDTKTRRYRKWTDEERSALMTLGFVSFVPTRGPEPESINELRSVPPKRKSVSPLVVYLNFKSAAARARRAELRKRMATHPWITRLQDRSQADAFCGWAGMSMDDWRSPGWRAEVLEAGDKPKPPDSSRRHDCLPYLIRQVLIAESSFGVHPAGEVPAILRPYWTEPFPSETLRPTERFNAIAAVYQNTLGIPGLPLAEVNLLHHIFEREDFGRIRRAAHRTAFWAAVVIKESWPHLFAVCADWTELLRRGLLASFLKANAQSSSDSYWQELAALHQRVLNGDPFLSSVFHYQVFDGGSWLEPTRNRGGQKERAVGLAAAYAVRALRKHLPKQRPLVGQLLPERLRLPAPPPTLPDPSAGTSIYHYLAPLITALEDHRPVGQRAIYLPETVRGMYNRYRFAPELTPRRLGPDLNRRFAETVQWMRRIANLP